MQAIVEATLRIIEATGVTGLVIVSLMVGLALTVVIVAHFSGVYAARRADNQGLDFADRLIGQVDKLSQREIALRADLERHEAESDIQRLRATELEADVALMRVQLRRAIEMLRAVRDGRLAPAAIRDADLSDALR